MVARVSFGSGYWVGLMDGKKGRPSSGKFADSYNDVRSKIKAVYDIQLRTFCWR